MTDIDWHEYPNEVEMAEASADAIADIISKAILENGTALIAVPGGGTPVPIMQRLAQLPLDWAKVTIIPGDDRLVPRGDPLSNVAMIERQLGATGARIVSLVGDDLERSAAAADAENKLALLHWPPDLVWLGMGGDGHTASIFPGLDYQRALDTDERIVPLVPNPLPPEAPVPRVTLSRSAIRSADSIVVTITGQAKREVLYRALSEGEQSIFPIGRVLAGTAPKIFWSAP